MPIPLGVQHMLKNAAAVSQAQPAHGTQHSWESGGTQPADGTQYGWEFGGTQPAHGTQYGWESGGGAQVMPASSAESSTSNYANWEGWAQSGGASASSSGGQQPQTRPSQPQTSSASVGPERKAGVISKSGEKFGFIVQDDGEPDLFVMPMQCPACDNRIPAVGSRVTYRVQNNIKTGRATAGDVEPEGGVQEKPASVPSDQMESLKRKWLEQYQEAVPEEQAPQAPAQMQPEVGTEAGFADQMGQMFGQMAGIDEASIQQMMQSRSFENEEEAIDWQNRVIAVYTQMQTQQQYEVISEYNKQLQLATVGKEPEDSSSKLVRLYKENDPHRTARGLEEMRYFEKQANSPSIFIGGLRTATNEEVLISYFKKFGEITFVEIKRLPDGSSRGFGFLNFKTAEQLASALAAKDSHMIDGKQIEIRANKPQDKKNKDKRQRY